MNTDEPKHKNIKTYNVQRTTYNVQPNRIYQTRYNK